MNRSGEEQERVLLYLEEEARKKQKRKLSRPLKEKEKWKGAGRGRRLGRASPFHPFHAVWEGCFFLRCSLHHPVMAGPGYESARRDERPPQKPIMNLSGSLCGPAVAAVAAWGPGCTLITSAR